jgi:hypothetical protein
VIGAEARAPVARKRRRSAALDTFEQLPKPRRRDPQMVDEAVKRGVRAAIASSWQKKPICLAQVITPACPGRGAAWSAAE